MAHTVNEHFEGREPHVREIYDIIVAAARELGPVEEDPKKTSIHLNRKSAFAGVATQKQALLLTLKSAFDIDSPRFVRREHASASRWYCIMKLASPDEIDAELLDWLRASYEISG